MPNFGHGWQVYIVVYFRMVDRARHHDERYSCQQTNQLVKIRSTVVWAIALIHSKRQLMMPGLAE